MKFGDPEKFSGFRVIAGYILIALIILLLLVICYWLYLSSAGASYFVVIPILILPGILLFIWFRYDDKPLVRIAFYVIAALAIGGMIYQSPQEKDYREILIGAGLILLLEITLRRHEDKPLYEIKDGLLHFKTNLGGWQACPLEKFEGKIITNKYLFMDFLVVPGSSYNPYLEIWLNSLRKKERHEFLNRLREAVAKAYRSNEEVGRRP